MSELVERHMQSMTEEIEEMIRTKLFTVEQTRAILKKRKQFEYKINGVTKNLQDIKDYIQYEKILLKNIKLTRNKYRIADRKNSIEFKIIKRIKYLYEIGLQRFSNDFSLCLMYFKFCKESNYHQAASLVIQNMIKNFSYNPEVWQVAAAWYMKRDVNQALNVIHKGLTIHKNCQLLYSEAIQLELLNREKDDWSKEAEKTTDELRCKKIMTYVQSIFKNINDFTYLLEILKLLEPHNFTVGVQNTIINKLLESYPNEELVWHTLAQRERNGHHYEITEEDQSKLKSTKFCLNRCSQKYQEGLLKVPKEKKSALWSLYLDSLIELQQQNDVANVVKRDTLLAALKEASDQVALEEKYFIVWAKVADDESETVEVLEKGIKSFPNSLELWKLRLKCAMIKDYVKEVNEIFKRAILNLKEKSASVWIMTLRYHTLTSGNEVLDLIYKDGVKQPKQVSDILKPEYIQWLSLWKGIREARKMYNLLAKQEPYCKELHTAMYKLESIEMEQDVDEMKNILQLACEQFGKEDVDVWINFVEFYLQNHKTFENHDSTFNLNDKILEIYANAENALKYCDGLLLSEFKERFDTVRNSTDI